MPIDPADLLLEYVSRAKLLIIRIISMSTEIVILRKSLAS